MDIKNKLAKPSLAASLGGIAVLAMSTHAFAINPQPIEFAGLSFVPTLSVDESYDDNVWDAPSDTTNGTQSSWVTRITPAFILKAQDRQNVYQFGYKLTREEVHSSKDDSHTDHEVSALAHMEFNARNRLDLKATFQDLTQRRDAVNNFLNETGNESKSYNLGGKYGFGAKTSKGQVEVGLNRGWLRFDNNYDTGSLTRESERDVWDFDTTFYYRVAPKTRWLAEFQHHDFDYLDSNSILDGESQIYRVGITWDATAKTSGTLKIGQERKTFDDPGESTVTNPSWDASITWLPRTYSTFTLTTKSLIEEGSSTENHIETESTSLAWNHRWGVKFSTELKYTYENQDYIGDINDSREDKIQKVKVGLNYHFRRWADVGLHYEYYDDESNVDAAEYDRNVVGINLNLSL